MEEGNDSTLELGSLVGSDGNGGEASPEDVLADIGCDEQRDTRAETVALLKELIEKDHNDASSEELKKDEDSVEGTEVRKFTVHAGQEVSKGLTKGDDKSEKLLSGLEKVSVLLGVLVHFDDLGTSEQLHNHA